MLRRTLKDKESYYMSASEINKIKSGSEFKVCIVSANANNGYILGYNKSSGLSNVDTNTSICSQCHEKVYVESKLNPSGDIIFNLANDLGDTYIYKEGISQLDELPTKTINQIILSNTYNGTTRYIGVNGTSIASTTSQETAISNDNYHWNIIYQNAAGRFYLYNPKSGRYIRYSNSTYSLSNTAWSGYFAYTTNGFTISNTNSSYSTKYYMYMSSNTALARSTSAQYWNIYTSRVSPVVGEQIGAVGTTEMEGMPVATVEDVLLLNGTRYLGLTTGNAITSTTSQETALNSKLYQWNLTYYSSGRFKIQNAQSTSRYIRYSNNAFSISTSSTNLYFGYNATNKYTIMGSNGSNYMYMSSNTALARNQYTAQYWHIYKPKYKYTVEWNTPVNMDFNKCEFTGEQNNVLAGYSDKEIVAISINGITLNHGNSLDELYFYGGESGYQDAWLIFDTNRYIIPRDEPLEPEIAIVACKYYQTESDTSWEIEYNYPDDLDKFDLTIVIGGIHGGLMLHYEDDSEIDASTITWDSLVIKRQSGAEIQPSNVSAVGWITDTTAYTGRHLTSGGKIGVGSRDDVETGETHPSAIGFTSGSAMDPVEELTFIFKGIKLK